MKAKLSDEVVDDINNKLNADALSSMATLSIQTEETNVLAVEFAEAYHSYHTHRTDDNLLRCNEAYLEWRSAYDTLLKKAKEIVKRIGE